jgi:threonine dehydrogenase-like Zn-dependent dehydrogenase
VVDQSVSGRKPDLVRGLGASFHTSLDSVPSVDVALECTGVGELIVSVVRLAPVTVLAGLCGSSAPFPVPRSWFDSFVLGNRAVVGSVNAGYGDYVAGAAALAAADRAWLGGLITRSVSLGSFASAFDRLSDDVKVVVRLDSH